MRIEKNVCAKKKKLFAEIDERMSSGKTAFVGPVLGTVMVSVLNCKNEV